VHPRFYGSYPRVLGRYVREQKIMSWEEAIRKSSALPAATVGLVDRGFISVGMAADIVTFDPNTVIDRATYEQPALPSEGIRHVLVNGRVALKDGVATGERRGRALVRTEHMPSRPLQTDRARAVSLKVAAQNTRITIDISQASGMTTATGTMVLEDLQSTKSIRSTSIGELQVTDGWASFTGRARVDDGEERAFTAIVDRANPRAPSLATVVIYAEPTTVWTTTQPTTLVTIK
ncbi:MAG: amidohydrolase family protein, partial [Vicinamibacterales bacterium]